MNIHNFYSSGGLDKVGAAVSWICAVHCLIAPVLVVSLPLVGLSFLASGGIEFFLIGLSIAIGAAGLLPAYFRRHRKIRTLLLFGAGIMLVISADAFFEEYLAGKIAVVIIGAICITGAHFINRKLCRACPVCAESGCSSLT
jgi:hypothetical protein